MPPAPPGLRLQRLSDGAAVCAPDDRRRLALLLGETSRYFKDQRISPRASPGDLRRVDHQLAGPRLCRRGDSRLRRRTAGRTEHAAIPWRHRQRRSDRRPGRLSERRSRPSAARARVRGVPRPWRHERARRDRGGERGRVPFLPAPRLRGRGHRPGLARPSAPGGRCRRRSQGGGVANGEGTSLGRRGLHRHGAGRAAARGRAPRHLSRPRVLRTRSARHDRQARQLHPGA